MFETLLRPIEVFQTPPLPSIADLAGQLKQAEAKREEKRLRQVAANRKAQAEAKEAKERERVGGEGKGKEGKEGGKRKRDDDDDGEEGAGEAEAEAAVAINSMVPKPVTKTTTSAVTLDGTPSTSLLHLTSTTTPSSRRGRLVKPAVHDAPSLLPASEALSPSLAPVASTSIATPLTPITLEKMNVAKALAEVRGHTSYLTFASLVPVPQKPSAPQTSEDDLSKTSDDVAAPATATTVAAVKSTEVVCGGESSVLPDENATVIS